MVDQGKIAATINWLTAGAQPLQSVDETLGEVAIRLNAAGVPLDLLVMNGMFIHPQARGVAIRWSKARGVQRKTHSHDIMNSELFWSLPQGRCVKEKRVLRFDVAAETETDRTGYFFAFSRSGYSDVVILPMINFDGSVNGVIEAATQAPDGFDPEQLAALKRMQAPLARLKEYFTENFEKHITLATYLGEKTSREVLAGNIRLGQGETISAVILFADIVDFTQLSNSLASPDVLAVLNRFFGAVDRAVSEHRGEILKFMGDGVLAIFQTPDDITAQEAAAMDAIEALSEARSALETATNALPRIDFRASLHVGDIFFGNIGSESRLDFTAIGPAVNLAARMLAEASIRDARTICSSAFRDVLPAQNLAGETCHFKGFDTPQDIFILA